MEQMLRHDGHDAEAIQQTLASLTTSTNHLISRIKEILADNEATIS
jgi:hypothetical protein